MAATIRYLVGPSAGPTIAFDRGGWSPATLAELVVLGFNILTYRNAPLKAEPRSAFREAVHFDEVGGATTTC